MSDVNLIPLDAADPRFVSVLLDHELLAWESELGWDYREVQRILRSFILRRSLPGYVAMDGPRPVGYVYFLAHASKGVIGTLYCTGNEVPQEVVDGLLDASVAALRKNVFVQRIEAQIIPFHNINFADAFRRQGFDHHPRQFLELNLILFHRRPRAGVGEPIVPWNPAHLPGAARVAWLGYRNQIDALLSEDYSTEAGCESYLRSLVETPGCGTFQPAASYVSLDDRGSVCGFIIVSRISRAGSMIPQISILPSHQGRGLGRALMGRALTALSLQGYRTVSLTVSVENRKALEWYQRQGFRLRKAFEAYVWQR
jgi:ribosomal protein S18 acetylase RimI-like enzyme